MRVTLYDLNHQLPDNIDVLLVGPGGQKYILMGDAGGATGITASNPVTLTFMDNQAQVLPDSAPLTTGKYEPTNWETPVSNFPAPAPAGPYVEPGVVPGGPVGTTMFGTFGLISANGTWSLYVRDDGGTFVPEALVGSFAGGWGLQFFTPTASNNLAISGRVTTSDGQGLRNARVTLTGNSLEAPMVTSTGSFGYYTFEGLRAGETYIVTVGSQRYLFQQPSMVISLVDSVTNADFVGMPFAVQQ